MSNVQIFVEGVTDQKFLQDIVEEWYGIKLTLGKLGKPGGDIISLDGKDAFDSPVKLSLINKLFEYISKDNKQAIVLFDADEFLINHDNLAAHSNRLNFSYFLFPDHQRDGEIETLLEEIIYPENQIIFNCWTDFESCLSQHETTSTTSGRFTTPANKTKIYAYVETLVGETESEKEKIKDRNRDYRNSRHWNLDPTHPPLKALKEFLDPFFSIQ